MRERAAIVALGPVDKADALYQLAMAQHEAGDDVHARKSVLRVARRSAELREGADVAAHARTTRGSGQRGGQATGGSHERFSCRGDRVRRWSWWRNGAARRSGGGGPADSAVLSAAPTRCISRPSSHGNLPYDGRFTFARIRTAATSTGRDAKVPGWSHDYPDAEENFAKILRDITHVRPFVEAGPMVGSVLVASMIRSCSSIRSATCRSRAVGIRTTRRSPAFRAYLLKGGFMIFDDFREGLGRQHRLDESASDHGARRFPTRGGCSSPANEPIFHSFFKIDLQGGRIGNLGVRCTTRRRTGVSTRTTIPRKRLIVIANVDNDIGESWQWSASGFVPIDRRRTRRTSWASTT